MARWASFMNYDLEYIDLEEKTLQPLQNAFGPKVYVSGTFCKGSLRTVHAFYGAGDGNRTASQIYKPHRTKAIDLAVLSFQGDSLNWKPDGN